MKNKVYEIIREILEEGNKAEVDTIELDTSLRKDLGFDSLDLALLTVKIEDEFDVDIFENGLIDTVGEILNIIEQSV